MAMPPLEIVSLLDALNDIAEITARIQHVLASELSSLAREDPDHVNVKPRRVFQADIRLVPAPEPDIPDLPPPPPDVRCQP
jgi:hypothetical protein